MPVRSSLSVIAVLALMAVLALPASASAAVPAAGDQASGAEAAGKPPRDRKARHKAKRRCRAGRVRRQRLGHLKHKRPCRRRARLRRRHRPPAPGGPILPMTPPPALVPPAPLPPPVAPAPPAAGCAGADSVPSAANVALLRAATLCLVNAERARYGIAALADNAQLASAAQAHASDMTANRYFSHVSADGRTFDQRIHASGYFGSYLAENIAWGGGSLGTPRRIVAGWMNSAGHRANILNGLLVHSGIGVSPGTPVGGGGGTYVHDFGAP